MRDLLKALAAAGAVAVVMTARLSPVGAATPADMPSALPGPPVKHSDTSFVVGFDEGVDAARASAIALGHGMQPVRWIEGLHVLVVNAPATVVASTGDAHDWTSIDAMSAEATVDYVEPDAVVTIQGEPDDPLYATDQWAPQLIDAPLAWDLTSGTSAIVVAVVDTGIDPDHPDLDGKLVTGTDIYNDDDDPSDDNGHGTLVAGVVGAATNNGLGIAGIGYDAKLMPVKVADYAGLSSYSRISAGIVWATDHGADVINVSMGATADLANLRSAVAYAESAGVVVVAAAGNHGSDTPFFPAAYDTVIGVGATDASDGLWTYSAYGDWLSLTAPGVSVTTTRWAGSGGASYASVTGTSYAAPHVAGAAALVLAADDSLTASSVRTVLQDNAVDLGDSGFDVSFGHGRVDAGAATLAALPDMSSSTMLLSLAGKGTIAGVQYAGADILAYDSSDGSWSMFFDASDVGVTKADLTAFATLPDGDLLLTFSGKVDVDGISGVTRSDVLRFAPSQLGTDTAGTFSMYFDGSDVGLHKNARIDALAIDANQNLLLSLAGKGTIAEEQFTAADILAYDPSDGSWSTFFDASDVGISNADLNAFASLPYGDLLLTFSGHVDIEDVSSVARADILRFTPSQLGYDTTGSFSMYLDGSDVGLYKRAGIDGLDINVGW